MTWQHDTVTCTGNHRLNSLTGALYKPIAFDTMNVSYLMQLSVAVISQPCLLGIVTKTRLDNIQNTKLRCIDGTEMLLNKQERSMPSFMGCYTRLPTMLILAVKYIIHVFYYSSNIRLPGRLSNIFPTHPSIAMDNTTDHAKADRCQNGGCHQWSSRMTRIINQFQLPVLVTDSGQTVAVLSPWQQQVRHEPRVRTRPLVRWCLLPALRSVQPVHEWRPLVSHC